MAAAKSIEACERALLKLVDADAATEDAGDAYVSVTVRRYSHITGPSRWISEEWRTSGKTADGIEFRGVESASAAKLIAKVKAAIDEERRTRNSRPRIAHRPKRLEFHP